MTLRYKKFGPEPIGDKILVGTIVDKCSTVISLVVDPDSSGFTTFVSSGNFASIAPAPGLITEITEYTVTLGGYAVGLNGGLDSEHTEFFFELKTSEVGTIVDSYGDDRYHTVTECGTVILDPEPPDVKCLDCDFNNNDGFGFDWR